MNRIAFIGAGIVGTALAVCLKRNGYSVSAVTDIDQPSAERLAGLIDGCAVFAESQDAVDGADLVFVTTPDDAIAPAVDGLSWRRDQSVVHCSGAASRDILGAAERAGAQTGSFHPLQSFADLNQALKNLPGSTFAIEADGELLETLKVMTEDLGGRWLELKPGDKALYHAAAVFAGNYLSTVVKVAVDLWQVLGFSAEEALDMLLPLARGTIGNLAAAGLPDGLTGPVARGDVGTIERHLESLEERAPALLPVYRELGRMTIPIALAKGKIDEDRAGELYEIFG